MQEPQETAPEPIPEPILIGYMAKRVEKRPEWLNAPVVEEICSVSKCISEGIPGDNEFLPEYNSLWLWQDETAVNLRLAQLPNGFAYDIFAYRLLLRTFGDEGEDQPLTDQEVRLITEAGQRVAPHGQKFEFLGYDCPCNSVDWAHAGFGCSPLSCNGRASEIAVNRYCLIDTLDDAIATARTFAREQPEPGDYYVIEVWRKRRGDANP